MAAPKATAGGAVVLGFLCSEEKDEGQACMKDSRSLDVDDGGGEWADLEPFFFDVEEAVDAHRNAMWKKEQRRQEKEREKEHEEKIQEAYWDSLNRIREYDPKHGRTMFTRIYHVDFATFDLDEESPLGPMRETDALIEVVHGNVCRELPAESANILASDAEKHLVCCHRKEFVPCDSVNVFSVKIVSSDVGFPVHVYGTVIARDDLDLKCVYLFRRDRDDCELILTKDESLILTGPKRGLGVTHNMHFEIDLKIKGGKRKHDRQLSKGFLTLNSLPRYYKFDVKRACLDTRLSKVAIAYAFVKNAVEATFAVEVVQGRFYGEITARTTSIRDSIVLHDSRLSEAMDGNGEGTVQLLRRVLAVGLKEKLVVTIAARTVDGKTKIMTAKFTRRVNGADEKEISFGLLKMRVKVTWSIIEREYLTL